MIANLAHASRSATTPKSIMIVLAPLMIWAAAPAAAQDCGATIGPAEPGDEVVLERDIGPCESDPALTIEGPVTVT